ncbi:type 2 lantipeptide synthetase LanM [Bacillus atrophaeus]|nr:type 2 lantipeptide synthetase LanM [Bacillus atrophaeus]
MQTKWTQTSIWNRSSSLSERHVNRSTQSDWKEITNKRFERWKNLVESDEGIRLKDILAAQHIDEEILKNTIDSEKVKLINDVEHNEWLEIIKLVDEQAYKDINIEAQHDILFSNFVKPFLKLARGKLEEKLNGHPCRDSIIHILNQTTFEELLHNLGESLASLSSRTLILELNVARVSGKLQGETSEERAAFYSQIMLNDPIYTKSIREEYLVLSRLLATKTMYWIRNTFDILVRAYQDKQLLESEFNNGQPLGLITSIDTGSGVSDAHNKGKTVAILTYESGVKLVYKPRSLEIDEKFNKLVNYINHKGLSCDLKTVHTLNLKTYGWTQFIPYKECKEDQQISKFYWRIGSYLAILYAMDAVDFHHQNLIANGEYPILIDLESLFHNNSTYTDSTAYSHAQQRIERSVLRIGLLPRKIGSKVGIEGIDLSAIGAQEGQVSPHKTSTIVDREKDTVRIIEKNFPIPVSHHRPMLNGLVVNTAMYEDDIVKGFEETYTHFVQYKQEIIEQMEAFKGVAVRQILRGTSRYANLLRISLHPDFMRDGLDREMILDKLWLDTKLNPNLKRVVQSEKEDLYLGDIPYFISNPESTDMWNSKGQKINNFFQTSALQETKIKINEMNERDCKEQVSFIKTAILVIKESNRKKHKAFDLRPCEHVFEPTDFLKEAIKIGNFIISRAIEGEQDGQKDVSWIGSFVDNQREDQFKISAANSTLYEGVAGISLFLAYLGYHSKDDKFTELSKQALVPVLKNLSTSNDAGAFGGIASYLYLLDHLSKLWNDEELLKNKLEPALKILDTLIEKDENNDILTGVAGTAIVLINLFKRYREEKILKMIVRCGNRLIQNLKVMEQGVGWKVQANPTPASGFAHGASGIIWTLYEIYAITEQTMFKEVADRALEFERTLFIPEKNNWADIKLENGCFRNENFFAWCNGAAGIALSRVLILPYNQLEVVKDEAKIAINTILKNGFEHDHSLCHGDLGNLDILMYASEMFNEKLKLNVTELSHKILNDIHQRGWLTGFEKNNESPSLMMGYSGIGLGLLKIFAPTQVPSVLRLQSPLELKI